MFPSFYQVKKEDESLSGVAKGLGMNLDALVGAAGSKTLPPVGSYLATGLTASAGQTGLMPRVKSALQTLLHGAPEPLYTTMNQPPGGEQLWRNDPQRLYAQNEMAGPQGVVNNTWAYRMSQQAAAYGPQTVGPHVSPSLAVPPPSSEISGTGGGLNRGWLSGAQQGAPLGSPAYGPFGQPNTAASGRLTGLAQSYGAGELQSVGNPMAGLYTSYATNLQLHQTEQGFDAYNRMLGLTGQADPSLLPQNLTLDIQERMGVGPEQLTAMGYTYADGKWSQGGKASTGAAGASGDPFHNLSTAQQQAAINKYLKHRGRVAGNKNIAENAAATPSTVLAQRLSGG